MRSPYIKTCLLVLASTAAVFVSAERKISWWFDVAEDPATDALNAATIKAHRNVFSRVMPYNAKNSLDGNVSSWWDHDTDVAAWNKPLQELGVPVLPYLIDIDNSTQMHLVFANSTAITADAVKIAEHYGFQGWFIDYEPEYPPDSDPNAVFILEAFLNQLGYALHQKNMSLTICVAGWSKVLSNYAVLGRSAVDELQQMSTYARPGSFESLITDYFEGVKKGAGNLQKAGVGIGVYYDGRNGYPEEWTEANARSFIQYVIDQGGEALDIYRLLKDPKKVDDWPHADWWWDVLGDFMNGGNLTKALDGGHKSSSSLSPNENVIRVIRNKEPRRKGPLPHGVQ